MHDQWTRFDRLSPDKFMIAMYHSLPQAQKNADGDCKLVVETLQDSNLSSKSVSKFVYKKSQCFHFPNSNISVIPTLMYQQAKQSVSLLQ